jgi:hypothetical protein
MKHFSLGRRALWALAMVLATAVLPAFGEDRPDPVVDLLDGKVKQFLEAVSVGEAQTAYQKLLAGSQLAKQTEAVKTLVDKTRELKARYGEYRTFERIAVKRVGNDLVLLKYLYKCEHFPVIWYFTFYRTPQRAETASDSMGTWLVVIVRFDTELEKLAW